MSLMQRAMARKGIEQESMATLPGTVYLPLENRQTWTYDPLVSSNDGALAIATFWDCVRVLSEGIASLPLILYRRLDGGGKERATDHPLYDTLHNAPNPEMTAFTWRELMMEYLATWGNAYNEIVLDPLGRKQFWPINPARIEVKWGSGSQRRYTFLKTTGEKIELDPDTVLHIKGMSPDGLRGYSPVEVHRRTLKMHEAARAYGQSTYDNNARPAVVLSHPKTLSPGAITRLAGQMDELKGSRNAGKTVVLEEDLKVTTIGIPPEDAQYLGSRMAEAREIQRIFRMQPHKVGDLEHATYTNIEQQNLEHVQDTLRPWLVRIEQELQLQVIRDPLLFAEHLVDGLLRGDSKARAEALQIRRQNGTISADEWREIENENPLPDDLGKTYWMPVNFQPVTNEEEEPEPEEVIEPEPVGEEPTPLFAVRSAAVRCTGTFRGSVCGKLLAQVATPPYRFACPRCKATTSAAAPVKSAEPEVLSAVVEDRPSSVEVRLPDSFKIEVPPVKWEDMPERPAPVVNVTMDRYAEAFDDLRAEIRAPRRRRIVRDANNVITEVIEETA